MGRHSSIPSTIEARARGWLGLTQAEFAEWLGVSTAQVSHVEAGRRELSDSANHWLYLLLKCLPPPIGTGLPDEALELAPLPPPALGLAVAPPPPAELLALQLNPLRKRLRDCRHEARELRYELEHQQKRVRQWARWRRTLPMLLTSLPPEPVTTPATAKEAAIARHAAYLREWLTARAQTVAAAEAPGARDDPAQVALLTLRLALLEAEAHHLSEWLPAA